MSLLARRRAVARVVTALFMLGAASPAFAFTPNVEREWDHFVECLPLMFSDPAAHQKLCAPSRHQPSLKSLAELVTGAPPVPSTPPECPIDGPCEPECIPDLPCDPGCLPDFPCPPDNRG
jgi:hypothetical protein